MRNKLKRIAAHAIIILLGSLILAAWSLPSGATNITPQFFFWAYVQCVAAILAIYAFCGLLALAVSWLDEERS